MTITTKMWQDAGLPFELWLRYAQVNREAKRQTEELFAQKYPHLSSLQSEVTSYTEPQDIHQ